MSGHWQTSDHIITDKVKDLQGDAQPSEKDRLAPKYEVTRGLFPFLPLHTFMNLSLF